MEIKLKLLKKLKGGVKVWLVDGDLVRQKYYNDFIEGGHDKVYKWMPSKEIWIDDKLPAKNREAVILHEDHERHLMSHGMTYDKAHRSSSIVEGEAKAHHKVAERLRQEEIMKKNPRKALAVTLIPRLIPEDEENNPRSFSSLRKEANESALWRGHSLKWPKHEGPRGAIGVCRKCGKWVQVLTKPAANETDIGGPAVSQDCTAKNPDKFGKLTPSELAGMTPYGMYDPAPREKKSSSSGDGWGGLLTLIVIGSVVGVVMYFAKKADNPTPPGPTF